MLYTVVVLVVVVVVVAVVVLAVSSSSSYEITIGRPKFSGGGSQSGG